MKQVIYKYPLEIIDSQSVQTIRGKILSIDFQNDYECCSKKLVMWVLGDTEADKYYRMIQIVGTGHVFNKMKVADRNYITTVQENCLVWHIFELR